MSRIRRVNLDPSLRWIDLIGVAILAGIGFTVSLLIADLSFTPDGTTNDHAKVGILLASVLAALLASVILRSRNRVYRRIEEADAVDADSDGIPDVYQQPVSARNAAQITHTPSVPADDASAQREERTPDGPERP